MEKKFVIRGESVSGVIKERFFETFEEANREFRKIIANESAGTIVAFNKMIDNYCNECYPNGAPEEFSMLKDTLTKLATNPDFPENMEDLQYFSFGDDNIEFDMIACINQLQIYVNNPDWQGKFPQAEIGLFERDDYSYCYLCDNPNDKDNALYYVYVELEEEDEDEEECEYNANNPDPFVLALEKYVEENGGIRDGSSVSFDGETLSVEEHPEWDLDEHNEDDDDDDFKIYKIEVNTGTFTFSLGKYYPFAEGAIYSMQTMIAELITRVEGYEMGFWEKWKESNFPEMICNALTSFEKGEPVLAPTEDIIGENDYLYRFTADELVIEESENAEYSAVYCIRTNLINVNDEKGEYYFEIEVPDGPFGCSKVRITLLEE